MLKEKSSENWVNIYKKAKPITRKPIFLDYFQRVMFYEISKSIKDILSIKDRCSILSAGCGVDFIANKLKKKFGDRVEITLFDVSKECIDLNKKLFGNDFKYIVGNIFEYKFYNKCDVVYNTGLLEHFTNIEQKEIIASIKNVLNETGFYVTLNPNSRGKLYKKCMQAAKKNGEWEFGDEIPIDTLRKFGSKNFTLDKEYSCCSFVQFDFLRYISKPIYTIWRVISIPVKISYTKELDNILKIDSLLGRHVGYYGLVSVFKKQPEVNT